MARIVKGAGRYRLADGVDTPDRAGRRAGAHGVDDDDFVGAFHRLEKPRAVAVALDRGDAHFGEAFGDDRPGGVVAAQAVADADDQHGVRPDRR